VGPNDAVVLHTVERAGGVAIRDIATLDIEVSDRLHANRFPLPRKDDRRITQDDFPSIVAAIRSETNTEFGEPSDHP